MKPLHILGVLLLSLVGGYVGALIGSPAPQVAATTNNTAVAPANQVAVAPSAPNKELQARLDELDMRLGSLSTKMDQLGALPARLEAPESVAAKVEAAVANAAPSRDTILRVIEEDRAAQEAKREAERKERELQQAKQRADRTAQRLNMSPGQAAVLADFYVQERTKFDELRNGWQGGGDPEAMREQMRTAREWRDAELVRLFGTDLGAQLSEQGFEGMGRGGRGGNNGGGGNAAGAAGGQQGGRGNRGGGNGGGGNGGGNNGQNTQPAGGGF
jgi:hypothetical protein